MPQLLGGAAVLPLCRHLVVLALLCVAVPATHAEGHRHLQSHVGRAVNTSRTPWVYVHIPKAAGTTITEWLKARLRPFCTEVNVDNPQSLLSAVQASLPLPASISKVPPRNKPVCHFVHLLAGPDGDQRHKLFHTVPITGLKMRVIMGHIPFGYCVFAEFGCRYVTVMREPRERLYSHFHFLKRNFPVYLRNFTCAGLGCETFPEFVGLLAEGKLREPGLQNMQTRMVAGMSFWSTLGTGLCDSQLHGCDDLVWISPNTVKVAKRNLAIHFSVIGMTDDLEGFRRQMVERYGLENVPLPAALNTMGPAKAAWSAEKDLDLPTQKLLNETQKLDLELYAFARRLIARREQLRQQKNAKAMQALVSAVQTANRTRGSQ